MNILHIFLPYICGIAGAFLYYFTFLKCLSAWKKMGLLIFYFFLFLLIISFTPDKWIQATPTKGWKKDAQKVDTAIILGFGYKTDEYGNMIGGEANQFLMDWVIQNTQAKLFFVQEAIWVTCKQSDTTRTVPGIEMRRIHPHNEEDHINTLEAAFYAMAEMEKAHINKAILVAHNLQLARAAWDFEKVKGSRRAWRGFLFIIPKMPNTPFSGSFKQPHTNNEWFYKIAELLISRPRDFLSPI